MVGASISGEGNGSLSQKRQRCSDDKRLSATLLDLNILDCPVCFEALTIPIFQCENGHLACSSCCPKLRNKCPACACPIGHNRCRAMESVLESIFVPCPNAKLGCTKKFSYGKESTHEKECNFSLCSCPLQECDYTGSYKDFYDHFNSYNLHGMVHTYYQFTCGSSFNVTVNLRCKILIISEYKMRLLFVVQYFREPCGVYVTVSCIAPPAPEVGQFSYHLSYTEDGHTITYESPEVKRVLEVSFQTPQDNFMLIPQSFLRGEWLSLKVCIKKLNQE